MYMYIYTIYQGHPHTISAEGSAKKITSPDVMAKDTKGYNLRSLLVFAVNFNILRILSGMGGLSFSN